MPDKVRRSENGMFEVWWNRLLETMQQAESNCLDIVVVDQAGKRRLIVDLAVPSDRNVAAKEEEKVIKYFPLGQQIRKLHNVSSSIVPIVVANLGVVIKRLQQGLKELCIPDIMGGLKTSAITGTTDILSKVQHL